MSAPLGLLDTSFFIARETGRAYREELLPEQGVISTITLGELHTALHTAPTPEALVRRIATFETATAFQALPVTSATARHWGRLRAAARTIGQARVNDLWIAATALEHGISVVTQDRAFRALEALGGPPVIEI
ncbi:MAG: PIN domain-containing protein [Bifidobacteriaceae bacterium]|nr:PIN domain-containing protein [Bifidobacteriaceae bacterium]